MTKIREIDVKALRHANAPIARFYPFGNLIKSGDYLLYKNANHVDVRAAVNRFMKSKKRFPLVILVNKVGNIKVTRSFYWPSNI